MSMLPSSLPSSVLSISSPMFVFLLLLSFITFTPVSADDNTYNINNAPGFIGFANKVNDDGTTFSGTTVLLNGDIDFSSCSGDFKPAGDYYSSNYFTGTFDGQGHTITNLVVNSSGFKSTGLFGYSSRLTIKNLIIDSSCSFTSYYNPSSSPFDTFVSSVIGYCGTSENACTIEGVVNMADVSYLHGSRSYVIAGGIVGKCGKNCFLTNIVNFGSVLTTSDKSSSYIYSGGIVGEAGGTYGFTSIRNCINYGTVTNTIQGNEYTLIGGVAGAVWLYVAIENCLVAGPVSSVESSNSYTGSVIGGTGSSSSSNNTINSCFWTESVGSLNASGQVIDDNKTLNITNASTIEMNESGIAMIREIMNTGTSSECGWVTVHLNGGGFGNSTQEDLLILFQKGAITDPLKEGHSFVTWCNDTNCTKSCNSSSVSECTSAELYAAWTINNYTLTIDFDNGTVVDEEIEFNSTISITNVSEREGYKFIGWNDTIPTSMPAHNIAIKAVWVNVTSPSDFIEIIFGTKDLSDNEINEIIQKYAEGGYKIVSITPTNDGISVIVKFNGVEEAIDFINNISASSEKEVNLITRIDFLQEEAFPDLSSPFNPLSFLFIAL